MRKNTFQIGQIWEWLSIDQNDDDRRTYHFCIIGKSTKEYKWWDILNLETGCIEYAKFPMARTWRLI